MKRDALQYLLDKYDVQPQIGVSEHLRHVYLPQFRRDDLGAVFAELEFTTGVEIGTLRGEYAATLCRAQPNLHLFCVDPWGQFDNAIDYTIPADDRTHRTYEEFYQQAKATLSIYPNVTLIRKTSMGAVNDFTDNSLDFVYIDGNHEFSYISEDLDQWGRKVRSGGFIMGHDYVRFDGLRGEAQTLNGVKRAVDTYVHAHQISPWFLIDQPHSRHPKAFRSFLWVKE